MDPDRPWCLGRSPTRPHRGRVLLGVRPAGRAPGQHGACDGAVPAASRPPGAPTCCWRRGSGCSPSQTLLHYPALWWAASQRGRVPLHVSVTSGADGVTMIAGPGGVGKSTLLSAGLPHGEIATADNICACDSRTAYGLVEPLRVQDGPAARPRRTAAPRSRCPGGCPAWNRTAWWCCAAPPAGEQTTIRPLSAGGGRARAGGRNVHGRGVAALLAVRRHARAGDGTGAGAPRRGGRGGTLAARLPCVEMRIAARLGHAPIGELLRMAGAAVSRLAGGRGGHPPAGRRWRGGAAWRARA